MFTCMTPKVGRMTSLCDILPFFFINLQEIDFILIVNYRIVTTEMKPPQVLDFPSLGLAHLLAYFCDVKANKQYPPDPSRWLESLRPSHRCGARRKRRNSSRMI